MINYYKLKGLVPLLKQFRHGKCCEQARKNTLSVALNDSFEDLGQTILLEEINKDPYKYYNIYFETIRKEIIKDSNLSNAQKIELLKLIN